MRSLSGTPSGDFAARSNRSESSQPGPLICNALRSYATCRNRLKVAFSADNLPFVSRGPFEAPLPLRFTLTVATSNAGDCARTAEPALTMTTITAAATRMAISPPATFRRPGDTGRAERTTISSSGMNRRAIFLQLILFATGAVLAAQNQAASKFEVASVKPAGPPHDGPSVYRGRPRTHNL